MQLRPELTPPPLDESKVRRLADLANRLDGAERGGGWEDDLAEFNDLAGTDLGIREFQGIYGATDADEWVRNLLHRQSLAPDARLSRDERAEVVRRAVAESGRDGDFYLELFLCNCRHPSGTDLIFWPDRVPGLPRDREPTAEEIADAAMGWEPQVVAMRVAKRSGGESVGYLIYNLEAPGTPPTQVVTPLDVVYEKGDLLAVALKGVRLRDGSTVTENFDFRLWSCGRILGTTDEPEGTRLAGHPAVA